jgi:peptidoglycan/LPS O-acetylase OafA/YrhL
MLLCYVFEAQGVLRVARHENFDAHTAFTATNVALNLFGFFPGAERFMDYGFLVPGWALRVEMLFYLAIAATMTLAVHAARFHKAAIGPAGIGLGMAILTAPLAVLATRGKAPAMLQFAPYFVYGAALYQWTRRPSRVVAALAAAALAGSFLQFAAQPTHNATLGFERAVGAEFTMLALLLATMTGLAFARWPRFKRADQALGDWTYVLYVSHPNVGILVLSMTVGYSYLNLVAGCALSLIVTLAARALLDPAVDRLRDAIRGRALDREPAPTPPSDRIQEGRFGANDGAEQRAA